MIKERGRVMKLLLQCLFGHPWLYDLETLDSIGRPIHRHCTRCGKAQSRLYNGYNRSGFGGWR